VLRAIEGVVNKNPIITHELGKKIGIVITLIKINQMSSKLSAEKTVQNVMLYCDNALPHKHYSVINFL